MEVFVKMELFSVTINFNCLMGEFRGSVAACFINIRGHAIPGNVHLSQPTEDLLGTGVVVLGDEALQLGNQCLGCLGCRGQVAEHHKTQLTGASCEKPGN